MAQNDFKSFAVGAGANVTSQAEWESLAALVTGFQSGKASSAQVNKAIRQASFIAAALAQYTSNKTGGDVLDDGDQAAFITKMAAAFGKDFQPLDATLTALAALIGAADKLPYFNGPDTATLTALTGVGRDIIGKTTVAEVLSYLGLGNLGTAALKDVGTGVGKIPDMSAWTGSYGASEAAGTWYKMPNGIIVQEGIFTSVGTGQVAVPLKIPFTSRILSFSATKNQGFFTPVISPKDGSLSEFWLGSTNGSGSWSNGDKIHWRLEGI